MRFIVLTTLLSCSVTDHYDINIRIVNYSLVYLFFQPPISRLLFFFGSIPILMRILCRHTLTHLAIAPPHLLPLPSFSHAPTWPKGTLSQFKMTRVQNFLSISQRDMEVLSNIARIPTRCPTLSWMITNNY